MDKFKLNLTICRGSISPL